MIQFATQFLIDLEVVLIRVGNTVCESKDAKSVLTIEGVLFVGRCIDF